jgi:hypothetical protein
MSALGRKRTFVELPNHLIGAYEHRLRHGNAERFGRLQVDDQLEARRLLDGKIAGFGAAQDLSSSLNW